MVDRSEKLDVEVAAYQAGQRRGLAIAALAVAIVAFIQLLGIEKSLLAIVLGVLSIRGAAKYEQAYGWGRLVVFIAMLHIIFVAVALVLYRSTLVQLLHLLQKIG